MRWDNEEADERLDAIVARRLELGLAETRRLIDAGLVRVAGRKAKKGDRVPAGTAIEMLAEVRGDDRDARRAPVPEHGVFLDVVFEDDAIFAVNKPAGMPSHPLMPGERGTVANSIVAQAPACAAASEDPREGGLVHRLDVGTTGVLVAGKTRAAWTAMRRAFAEREVVKIYWALVHGELELADEALLVLDAPLATRGGTARIARDTGDALDARTEVSVLTRGGGYSLVEARARTGRMHQIRAHLASAGHPLVGDPRYGAPYVDGVVRDEPLLHARSLSLPHPADGWRVTISAHLPAARRAAIERLLGATAPT